MLLYFTDQAKGAGSASEVVGPKREVNSESESFNELESLLTDS